MAVTAGVDGEVAVGANVVAETRDWSLERNANTVPRSVLGDVDDRSLVVTRSWSVSANVYYDPSDTTGQAALAIGAEVTINLFPGGNTSGQTQFSGSAHVTQLGESGNRDGLVERSISLTGNGPLTESLVA